MGYIQYPHAVIHNGTFYPAHTPIEVIEVTATEVTEVTAPPPINEEQPKKEAAPVKPTVKNARKKGMAKDDK